MRVVFLRFSGRVYVFSSLTKLYVKFPEIEKLKNKIDWGLRSYDKCFSSADIFIERLNVNE